MVLMMSVRLSVTGIASKRTKTKTVPNKKNQSAYWYSTRTWPNYLCCLILIINVYFRLSGCREGEEMPLAGRAGSGVRAGPAQCSPARRLDTSSCDVSSLSSGEEDERLRRYRTASGPPRTELQPLPLTVPPRRPPPRNVSFAGDAAELVLSPAQLRNWTYCRLAM